MNTILGQGSFGQVWLVSDSKRQTFAMKIQSKSFLAREGQINAVIREKEIMSQLRHPFITKLVKTYQDEAFVYILTEMIQGGELFSLLHQRQTRTGLADGPASFYALGVADALAYMHQKNIVYRDLKVRNTNAADSRSLCISRVQLTRALFDLRCLPPSFAA
jgi:protein kinase A